MMKTKPTLTPPTSPGSRWMNAILRFAQITTLAFVAAVVTVSARGADKKPNILVIFGDDIGQSNISAYSRCLMGFTTPNIDRIGAEGGVLYGHREVHDGRTADDYRLQMSILYTMFE